MLPDKPKRGRPRKFDTDAWYQYVGDTNLDIALSLKPGQAMSLPFDPLELESAKWQWYKTFRQMGKTRSFTISMNFDLSQLRIVKRADDTTAPQATVTEEPIMAKVEAPSEWPSSLTHLYQSVAALYEDKTYNKEQLTKMFEPWMEDDRAKVARALSERYEVPLPLDDDIAGELPDISIDDVMEGEEEDA